MAACGCRRDRYARAFAREIATTADRIGARTSRPSFSAAAPSLMKPETVRRSSTRSQALVGRAGCRVTLEANPTSVEARAFKGTDGRREPRLARRAGWTWIAETAWRLHSAQEALDAVAIAARRSGVTR